MKRPAFQFYAGDWRGNAKLRRCTHAERGIWIEVMCLMHDSEEYGVLRWPLKDIAQAVNCRMSEITALVTKEVLKGGDVAVDAHIYTPRHAGKDGEPVILIPEQKGPVWYSSRMVRDEYLRTIRGANTRIGAPDPIPDHTPNPPIGEPPNPRQGDGSTVSTSSSKSQKLLSGKPDDPPGFVKFWDAWPRSNRKQGRAKCLAIWKRKGLEAKADAIVAHVAHMAKTEGWQTGFDPMPETYLNKDRWDGADLTATGVAKPWEDSWSGIVSKGAELGIFQDEGESGPDFKARVMTAAKEIA